MIYIVTYASNDFYEQQRAWLTEAARRVPGMEHVPYDQEWLRSTEYYQINRSILDEQRGAGFWAWKPFIILDALDRCSKDDVVVYLDANVRFNADPLEWINSTKDMKLVKTHFINKEWTKRDCFKVMNLDEPYFWNGNQIWGGCICCRPLLEAYYVLDRWLYFCMQSRAVTDSPSRDNFPEFKDHRHDQSILSLLALDYGIPSYTSDIFFDH